MTTKKKRPAKKGAKKASSTKKRTAKQAVAVGTSAKYTVRQRVAAIAETPIALCESDNDLQKMLDVLRDRNEPLEIRLAALQSLQAATFSVVAFESQRPDYIDALREVATDPEPELRHRVLGILAREKDPFAQTLLIEGLQDQSRALVPPEKALQLLAYDVHAEAYAVARDVIESPPNEEARREALRLLAADATAVPIFEELLRDKNELAEIRQISASALQALQPETLQTHAREIVLDQNEYNEIKATSLTALTQFGNPETVANDVELRSHVEALAGQESAETSPVQETALRFVQRYR